ncbi:DUF4837 family protein [Flavobacterium taihuense]|uniref:DUF4837 family protein n=1 Tax=Flavobacterium taihuense TaxID=2857508 RepID=A0ABS6Y1Q1_9FLAO|nr:DUF4837 family protein [Flavobacterium taihuense]MBW4362431.1 DUF4837 family protein [Flavobacterium taihuense]
MIKTAILFVLLIASFSSCSKKSENSFRHSTGKINAISVVIDDQLWNGIVGDSIRNKFAGPVEGLPKEEPQFDLNQYPTNVMEGFVTKSRTIIVVKVGKVNRFKILKNQYATPQNVIHITGKSLSDLLFIVEKKAPQIIQTIQEGEIKAHQLLLKDSLVNAKAIQRQFQFILKIPKDYSYTVRKDSFLWLKKEFASGSTSLLVTQLPINSIRIEDNVLDQFVKIHDSIGTLYIKGKENNSCLYIDKSYPLYILKMTLCGKVTYEIKGTWRLKDSFMFGPFVNYLIVDSQKRRIVFLEGFCYVPSREKRNFMHELESIIKGVQVN